MLDKTECVLPYLLLIEDNRILSRLEERHLSEAFPHLRLSSARTGEEAIQLAKEIRPEVVVMDCHLPGTTSYREVLKQLHRLSPDAGVIITSAEPPGDLKERVGHSNIMDIIEKPFETEELVGAVARAIAERSASTPASTVPTSDRAGNAKSGSSNEKASFDTHKALSVLASVLTGIRALEADLTAEADKPDVVRDTLAAYVPRLVGLVDRLSSIIKSAPPNKDQR